MNFWRVSAGLIAALAVAMDPAMGQTLPTPFKPSPAPPPDACPAPPYAAELAEVSARAHAQFQVAISKVLQDQLAKSKPGSELKIALSGRMASAALGGFASQALIDTYDNYFCRLKVAARSDAPLIAKLRERHRQLREAVIVIFDPALYGQSPSLTAEERKEDKDNAKERHDEIKKEIKEFTPVWTAEAAGAALPEFNYTKVTAFQFNADAVIGSFVNAGACLGMVRKSIKVVKPEILVALDKARSNVIWWVTDEAGFVEQDIRSLASVILKAQASKAVEAEQQTVTPEFTTCVEESKKIAQAKAPSADPDPATAPNPEPPSPSTLPVVALIAPLTSPLLDSLTARPGHNPDPLHIRRATPDAPITTAPQGRERRL